jgi:hypothetical protein
MPEFVKHNNEIEEGEMVILPVFEVLYLKGVENHLSY